MFFAFALLSNLDGVFIVPYAGGLAAYFTSLVVFQEITREDFAAFLPWIKLKPYQVSSS